MATKKVAVFDPGRIRDGFGMLAASVDTHTIKILNGKEWYNTDVTVVCSDIAEIHKTAKFDIFLCESNNQGHPIIDVLKRLHKIHCIPISTVKDVKDKEKLKQGKVMPKNVTVEWVEYARQKEIILFPARPWPQGIRRLDQQLSRYVRKTTQSGTKYESAEADDHDDLVSCLLTLSHFCRTKILKIGYLDKGVIASKKFDSGISQIQDPEELVKENMRNRMTKQFPNIAASEINVRLPQE